MDFFYDFRVGYTLALQVRTNLFFHFRPRADFHYEKFEILRSGRCLFPMLVRLGSKADLRLASQQRQ
jgi:hypothetical protein